MGKRKYKDYEKAFDAAIRMQGKTGHEFDSYQCPHCEKWHIGHSMRELKMEHVKVACPGCGQDLLNEYASPIDPNPTLGGRYQQFKCRSEWDADKGYFWTRSDACIAAGELRDLRAKVERYKEALETIVDPMESIRKRAKVENCTIDGHAAMALINNANYLKNIARKALDDET